MKVNPYLTFSKLQCAEALKYYEKHLGGKVEFIMTFGESPFAKETPANFQKAVMHAHMTIGGTSLMASDASPERYNKPQGFAVSLNAANAAEAERVFKALADQGNVEMPIQETFWAVRFGIVTDRFGTPWMVNCEKAA